MNDRWARTFERTSDTPNGSPQSTKHSRAPTHCTGRAPVGLVVEVQRARLVHLLQLLPVAEVEGEVRGDDGFADDLKHLLVLAGAQGGEDVVPFQLWRQAHSDRHLLAPAACSVPPMRAGLQSQSLFLCYLLITVYFP